MSVIMDSPYDHTSDDAEIDQSSPVTEIAIREMLAQSENDIAAGRIVPMEPVLERMRATAERIRAGRTLTGQVNRRPS